MKLFGLLVALSLVVTAYGLNDVSSTCLRCLCEGSTSGCDKNAGCDSYGFCGPFRLSKQYWQEAGSFENDFEKCANEYQCAEKTVKAYMEKYGQDCDGDGDTDCQDFALIHHKGRNGCPYSDFQSDSLYKFVTECLKKREQPQSRLEDAGQGLKHKAGEVGENIQQGAHHDLGDNVQEQSQDLHGKAKETSQNIGDGIKGSLRNAKETVQEKFQGAKEGIQDSAKQVKEGAQDKFRDAKEGIQDSAKQVKDGAQDTFHRASDNVNEHSSMHQNEQHPSSAVPLPEMIRHRRRAIRY